MLNEFEVAPLWLAVSSWRLKTTLVNRTAGCCLSKTTALCLQTNMGPVLAMVLKRVVLWFSHQLIPICGRELIIIYGQQCIFWTRFWRGPMAKNPHHGISLPWPDSLRCGEHDDFASLISLLWGLTTSSVPSAGAGERVSDGGGCLVDASAEESHQPVQDDPQHNPLVMLQVLKKCWDDIERRALFSIKFAFIVEMMKWYSVDFNRHTLFCSVHISLKCIDHWSKTSQDFFFHPNHK